MIRLFKNLENFYLRKLGRSKKKLPVSLKVNMIANTTRKKMRSLWSLRKSLPPKMKSQYRKKRSRQTPTTMETPVPTTNGPLTWTARVAKSGEKRGSISSGTIRRTRRHMSAENQWYLIYCLTRIRLIRTTMRLATMLIG